MHILGYSLHLPRKRVAQIGVDSFMLKEVRTNCAFLYSSQLKSYHRLFLINLKYVIYCSRNKNQANNFAGSPFLYEVQKHCHFTSP